MNDFRNTATTATRAGTMDEGLRQYMIGVYNYMALGLGFSGILAFFIAGNQELMLTMVSNPLLRWAPFVAILGLGFFGGKVIFTGSRAMAHGIFWLYAAAWGFLVAPFFYFFQSSGDSAIIYRAFFITASLFAGISLFGYTTKRDMSGWAGFLTMAVIGLLIAIVANALIFQSSMMSLITSCLVVLVFSGVTAYETQMIKRLYSQGSATNERASIMGAFMLFGSFATLFIHIMNILGFMRD